MPRLELFHHFPGPGGSFLTLFPGPSARPMMLLREGRERSAGLQPVTQIHCFKVSDAFLPHPDALKCELLAGTFGTTWSRGRLMLLESLTAC